MKRANVCHEPATYGCRFHYLRLQVGAGTKMKLVVNMVMGTMMCAFGEGLELCTQQGLQAEQLLEVRGE